MLRDGDEAAGWHDEGDRELTLAAAPGGVWELDVGSGEGRWSGDLFEMLGVPRSEGALSVEAFVALVHPDDKRVFEGLFLARSEAAGKVVPFALDLGLRHGEGSYRRFAVGGGVRYGRSGEPEWMVCTFTELAGPGELLAHASRELRAPMDALYEATRLLMGTKLDAEQRGYAEKVRSAGENVSNTINDVIDLARAEAGAMRLEKIVFDPRTPVEEAVRSLAGRAESEGVDLVHLVEYGVPSGVAGDPYRVRQVITNLIGNALEHAEGGEVTLRVGLGPPQQGDDEVTMRFEVSYARSGEAPAEGALGPREGAASRLDTGVDRAITRRLVGLMGGEIGVEGTPDGGYAFWFTVVLERPPEEASGEDAAPPDLSGLSVLIVAGDAAERGVMKEQTASWGMNSAGAADGAAALGILRRAAAEGSAYDLVVLAAGADALGFANAVKEDPETSSTRLLLITPIGRRGDSVEARAAGIDAYLSEPVRQSELRACLAALTGSDRTAETASEAEPLVTRHSLREARSNVRVLVIEDDRGDQRDTARLLERLGYRVDLAENGRGAMEALDQHPYAAVLVDTELPGMDGYEVAEEVRRREAGRPDGRRTPVIAMVADDPELERLLAAGVEDHVSKPVGLDDLGAALKRWVSPARQEAGVSDILSIRAADVADAIGDDPIDRSVLADLRDLQQGGEPDVLSELVTLFLEEAPPRLETLREALAAGDTWTVERAAHTLKGSCANMGATRMSALAAELEGAGATADLTGARELVGSLEDEYARVRSALASLAEGTNLRVLVAEDDAFSRTILVRAVEKLGYECLAARDGEEAWQLYQRTPDVDVIISDWMMPGTDGVELCERVRRSTGSRGGYPFFIFLTTLGDREHLVRGIHAGADEYLSKPLALEELRARLNAAGRTVLLHKRLAVRNTELFEQSRHDPLTRLGNRTKLEEDLANMRRQTVGRRHAVLLCDVDSFKAYNDRYGHPAGDAVLREVADRISTVLRTGDTVYRYGGEEFAAVLPDQTLREAAVAAERLRGAVEDLAIPHEASRVGVVTVSVGLAELELGSDAGADGLFKGADEALYRAKKAGKNRVATRS